MARQDKANIFAESQSFRHGFTGGEIPANSDLNDIGPGVWECMNNVNAKTLENAPFDNQSFYMICLGTAGAYMVQIAYHYSSAGMATRRRNSDNPDLWSDWLIISYDQKPNNGNVADGADMQTYTDAGRYKINGTVVVNGPISGKIWASLEVDNNAGITRQVVTNQDGAIYVNVLSGSPLVWRGWKQITNI